MMIPIFTPLKTKSPKGPKMMGLEKVLPELPEKKHGKCWYLFVRFLDDSESLPWKMSGNHFALQ